MLVLFLLMVTMMMGGIIHTRSRSRSPRPRRNELSTGFPYVPACGEIIGDQQVGVAGEQVLVIATERERKLVCGIMCFN